MNPLVGLFAWSIDTSYITSAYTLTNPMRNVVYVYYNSFIGLSLVFGHQGKVSIRNPNPNKCLKCRNDVWEQPLSPHSFLYSCNYICLFAQIKIFSFSISLYLKNELLLEWMHLISPLFIISLSLSLLLSLVSSPTHTVPHVLIRPPVLSDSNVIGGLSSNHENMSSSTDFSSDCSPIIATLSPTHTPLYSTHLNQCFQYLLRSSVRLL